MFFRFTTHFDDVGLEKAKLKSKQQNLIVRRYPCRFADKCGHEPFRYKGHRDNHLLKVHNFVIEDPIQEVEANVTDPVDHKLAYMKASLTFNLLLRTMNDCVKEGDGPRLINAYKVAMLYFKCYSHHKYALSILKLLCTIKLEPKKAFRLIWSRFVNTKGKKGKNISLDLHQEHLNLFLKEQLKNLRVNLDESNSDRVAKSLNALGIMIENVERNLCIAEDDHYRKIPATKADIEKLAMEYKNADVFKERVGRQFSSFPHFDENTLKALNLDALVDWIKDKYLYYSKLKQLSEF